MGGPANARARATLGDVLYADDTATQPSERDWAGLVQSIATGDQRALHALYERTHGIVFTLTLRIAGSRETAEEVTLDVFHDVWRRASTYDPASGTVVGWIMNQARSRAIDRLRLEQRKKRVAPDGFVPDAEEAEEGGPHDALHLSEQVRILQGALAVLTPHERAAIETAFLSELTHAEAAEQLNEPLGTVKTRIRSALTKLRHTLAGKL